MQVEFKLPVISWKSISELKLNERNPRKITDDKFLKLKTNIEKHQKMMGIRPVVIDQNGIIMGGNMRFRACKELGWDKIPVITFDESWTEEEKKMFILVDNNGYGIWDYEIIGADYTNEEIEAYGMDLNYAIHEDDINSVDDEWEDVPEVNSGDKVQGAIKSIIVHFETEEDYKKFSVLVEQKITEKTKYIWFPFKEKEDIKAIEVVTEHIEDNSF